VDNMRDMAKLGRPRKVREPIPEVEVIAEGEAIPQPSTNSPVEPDEQSSFFPDAKAGKPLPARELAGDGSDKKIAFKITDGKIDYNSLRISTAETAKQVIKASVADEGFRTWAGLTAEQAPEKIKFPPEIFGNLLNAVAGIEVLVYQKRYAIPAKEIAPLVAWTKEEHSILDPQGAALMSRYFPEKWLQYSDVGVFALTLMTCLQAKARAVESLAKEKFERQVNAGPSLVTPADAPAPRPVVVPAPAPKPSHEAAQPQQPASPTTDKTSLEEPLSGAPKHPPMPFPNENVSPGRSVEEKKG
jgi:hypothetical protein